MASIDKSENYHTYTGRKIRTLRHDAYRQFKVLGNYLLKNGMFDQFPVAHILVIDTSIINGVITDSDARELGYDSKEEYLSYGFNGFTENDASKTFSNWEFVNLDLLYGSVDELDAWIDSELESKWDVSFN